MTHNKKIAELFTNFNFPDIDKPIAYNADSDKLTKYMKRLSKDKVFLESEAEKLGKEVDEMLGELEEKGIIK